MKIKIVIIVTVILLQDCIAAKKDGLSLKALKIAFENRSAIKEIKKKQSDVVTERLEKELLKSYINQIKDSMKNIHAHLKDIHADNFEQPVARKSWSYAKAHITDLNALFKKHKKLREYVRSTQGQKELKEEMTLLLKLNDHVRHSVIADIEDWNTRRRFLINPLPAALDKELEELRTDWDTITHKLIKRGLMHAPERNPLSRLSL